MIFFDWSLTKYRIISELMKIYVLWNLIIFLNVKTWLVITPPPAPPPTYPQRHYHALRTKVDMVDMWRIKIAPIYDNESSKPIYLIKNRIKYLTKPLLAWYPKIIVFFKFLLENVSRRFENDYNMKLISKYLQNKVYSSSLLRVIIAYNHLPLE